MYSSVSITQLLSHANLGPLVVVACLLLYALALVCYRIYLHPLRKFPGPKLAAVSFWHEFYYDVVKGGQYTFEIGRMHEEYGMFQCHRYVVWLANQNFHFCIYKGPIVRINPEELHCNDPAFIDILYTGSTGKRDKFGFQTSQFGYVQPEVQNTERLRRRI